MSEHAIKCRETGEALANKLDGGTCVCKPSECEMRKLRNREGDYAKSADGFGFDTIGFAIGTATGFPISPRGITAESIIGALLHPTERHASYDVSGAANSTPNDRNDEAQPVPARDVDSAPARDPDPAPQSAPVDSGYSPAAPSYSAPDPAPMSSYSPPSYTPPDPPSYDGGASFDSGGGGGD